MAGTKEIKNRIKSVKNTKKITKAMELVAASKMKRALTRTLASRMYAQYSWEVLNSIAENFEEISHPLYVKRDVKNILLVLVTSSRGLCGAYNAQVIKKALQLIKRENNGAKIHLATIGKKGDAAMRRVGQDIVASFTELPDNISLSDIVSISKFAVDEYNLGNYDLILVAYTDYITALTQRPNIRQILPISKSELIKELNDNRSNTANNGRNDYLFEGDLVAFMGALAEKLTRMQLYQMILESNASEQSSRMVAMKNASDASGEMIDDLTLVFNKARQANITREISEISAGMASVN